jgi:hypothetical protein
LCIDIHYLSDNYIKVFPKLGLVAVTAAATGSGNTSRGLQGECAIGPSTEMAFLAGEGLLKLAVHFNSPFKEDSVVLIILLYII